MCGFFDPSTQGDTSNSYITATTGYTTSQYFHPILASLSITSTTGYILIQHATSVYSLHSVLSLHSGFIIISPLRPRYILVQHATSVYTLCTQYFHPTLASLSNSYIMSMRDVSRLNCNTQGHVASEGGVI